MKGKEPEIQPSLGRYKSTIEIRERGSGKKNVHYRVVWRGISAEAETVPAALQLLAEQIEQQG